ncbi:DUF4870 domain-containing protein [Mariniluteicoccus endophyticus]
MNTTHPLSRPSSDECTAAVLSHLSAIIAMIVTAGWLSFVGPLVLWLLYKDRSRFVRTAAAGSFNFNLWAWLMNVVGWILAFTVVGIIPAIILWCVAGIMTLWCHIRGAMLASRGEVYRYPAQLRILS